MTPDLWVTLFVSLGIGAAGAKIIDAAIAYLKRRQPPTESERAVARLTNAQADGEIGAAYGRLLDELQEQMARMQSRILELDDQAMRMNEKYLAEVRANAALTEKVAQLQARIVELEARNGIDHATE